MTDTWSTKYADGSINGMQAYEDTMVANMFTPWGELLCDEVGMSGRQAVLDVACGPGTVSRIAARRVGPRGRVVGCDISGAMLKIARAKPAVDGGALVTYRRSPAAPLDAEDDAFDIVVCQHGFQFFPDRHAALTEMRRVLRSGGRLAIATWSRVEDCQPFASIYAGLERVAGHELAERYRAGPWALPDPDELRGLVEHAGLHDVDVTMHELTVLFESGADQALATLPHTGIADDVHAMSEEDRAEFAACVRDELTPFMDGDAALCPQKALIATAKK